MYCWIVLSVNLEARQHRLTSESKMIFNYIMVLYAFSYDERNTSKYLICVTDRNVQITGYFIRGFQLTSTWNIYFSSNHIVSNRFFVKAINKANIEQLTTTAMGVLLVLIYTVWLQTQNTTYYPTYSASLFS